MKKLVLYFLFISLSFLTFSQELIPSIPHCSLNKWYDLKLYSRKNGVLFGLQQGKFVNLEFGLEHQWKKMKLVKTYTYAVKANLEYNFFENVVGYKLGLWTRQGRVAVTYGLNFGYFTDFDADNVALTPAIGFKVIGIHFETGYNFVFGRQKVENMNLIYVTARYFFVNNRKIKLKRKKK